MTDHCGDALPRGPGSGDLKLIAMDGQAAETIKAGLRNRGRDAARQYTDYTIQLLKLVLVAAINSPKAAEFIQTMPTLSTATQSSLKDLIEEVMHTEIRTTKSSADGKQLQSSLPASDGDTSRTKVSKSPLKSSMDPELLFEERFGKVMADNDKLTKERGDLQKDLQDLHNRLARLQENNVSVTHNIHYGFANSP